MPGWRRGSTRAAPAARSTGWTSGSFLGGLSVLALLLAALPAGGRRPQALGLAGGALYAAADVAIKALTGVDHRHGLAQALLSPWLAAAALATIGAFFCFQRGLQAGRALPVIALMTAATNALSILAGFVVFGDVLGTTPALALLHVVSLGVVVGGRGAARAACDRRQARMEHAQGRGGPLRRRARSVEAHARAHPARSGAGG